MSIAKTRGGGSRPRRLLTGKSGGKGISSQQEVRQSRPQDCLIQPQQFAPDGPSHICARHRGQARDTSQVFTRDVSEEEADGTLVRDSVEASCQPWLGQLALLQAPHSQLRPWNATARQLHHESPQQALPLPAPRKQHFLMMPHYQTLVETPLQGLSSQGGDRTDLMPLPAGTIGLQCSFTRPWPPPLQERMEV